MWDSLGTMALARKLRVEYPGAVYHVMNRGDRREPIFHEEADRQRFVSTLGEACGKTKGVSPGYCREKCGRDTFTANTNAVLRASTSDESGSITNVTFTS